MKRERKIQTNLRLTPTARRLLVKLSNHFGISQADVMELALRYLDQTDGVQIAKSPP